MGKAKANVIHAAHHALRAAERLIKEGSTNAEVTEAMNKIVAEYECNMVEGVLSHNIKKYCIDGNQSIIGKEVPLQQVEKWEFERARLSTWMSMSPPVKVSLSF